MDAIDRIARVFASDCTRALRMFLDIKKIIDTSETGVIAHKHLKEEGFSDFVDMERLDLVQYEIGRYGRCLEVIDEAKTLASRIFAVIFFESDTHCVLYHEVCFSYACKMLSIVGPSMGHFSGKPKSSEVMHLELRLACETPFLALQAYADLLCIESMSSGGGLSLAEDIDPSESCILEELRQSMRRVPLTSCAKRRRKGSLSPLPKEDDALGIISPDNKETLLSCRETLTPPKL